MKDANVRFLNRKNLSDDKTQWFKSEKCVNGWDSSLRGTKAQSKKLLKFC